MASCAKCQGTGSIKCWHCDGKGRGSFKTAVVKDERGRLDMTYVATDRSASSSDVIHRGVCDYCRGTGRLPCPTCGK